MIRQNGFTIVEAVVIVVIIGIVGGVGYMAYTNFVAPTPATVTNVIPSASPAATPVTVNSTADLESANTALDAVSIDDADTKQLDSATNNF